MSAAGAAFAAAAQALVGSQFRFHGRDPATGLDCVGVVAVALQAIGHRGYAIPASYALRWHDDGRLDDVAGRCGLMPTEGEITAGDVVAARVAAGQVHLLVAAPVGGFIHAHAGLRRVVRTPAPLPWPVVRHWRLKDPS